jgi:FkbM family methyltransferase
MSVFRTLLEVLTRRWVLRRYLPPPFPRAPIYVSPSAGLSYLFRSMKNVDSNLLSWAQEFVAADSIVWDVGANVGLFSVMAANLAGSNGHVFAFEPDVWLVQLLRRTARAQASTVAPITVVPAAVASKIAIRTFVLARRTRSANYIEGYGNSETGGSGETTTVLSVSLDWLLTQFPQPTVVKIDVEGAELEVLNGSCRLFERARPIVIVEVDPKAASEVTKFFRERDYKLYNGDDHSAVRSPVTQAPWNTIAVPA